MSEIALPCQCKLCGAVIGHYALVWPPPEGNAAAEAVNEQQFGLFFRAISEHLQKATRARQPEHAAALALAIPTGGNLVTLKIAENFDVPEPAAGYLHSLRQGIHQMTRSFWMTDADLEALADVTVTRIFGPPEKQNKQPGAASFALVTITELLQGLRAAYEAGAEQPQKKKRETGIMSQPRLVI